MNGCPHCLVPVTRLYIMVEPNHSPQGQEAGKRMERNLEPTIPLEGTAAMT